jgi:hypothetical protein
VLFPRSKQSFLSKKNSSGGFFFGGGRYSQCHPDWPLLRLTNHLREPCAFNRKRARLYALVQKANSRSKACPLFCAHPSHAYSTALQQPAGLLN